MIGAGGDERIVCIDYITGSGQQLFEAVRQVGVGGIVSKRAGSAYRSGESRDWLKTKVSETAAFVITGFSGLGPGRLEALAVAELQAGVLAPAGMVIFGFAGKHLWSRLERLRAGPANRSGIVPVWPELVAAVRYFGRYRSGSIRDGVLLSVG